MKGKPSCLLPLVVGPVSHARPFGTQNIPPPAAVCDRGLAFKMPSPRPMIVGALVLHEGTNGITESVYDAAKPSYAPDLQIGRRDPAFPRPDPFAARADGMVIRLCRIGKRIAIRSSVAS